MKRILIPTQTPYDVVISRKVIANAGELTTAIRKSCKVAVITDDIVDALYGDSVCRSYEEAGYSVCRFAFENGEQSKNLSTFESILSFLAENEITRSDLVVALGGGVVGDLVGYSAASYLRGVDFVQIPTTFLAAIDSSVGGKTGLNLSAGKNLCGAFHQPRLVIVDCDTFKTLPKDRFADGIAEAIKYGVISDKTLFDTMKAGVKDSEIDSVVSRCVEIKRDFVTEDEFDFGLRRLLNLGHTFGHAIEKCSNYGITHGHAVAVGTLIAARAAHSLGLCAENLADEIEAALINNDLPTETDYSAEMLAPAMLSDKKRKGGAIALILPHEIGNCGIHDTSVGNIPSLVRRGLGEA